MGRTPLWESEIDNIAASGKTPRLLLHSCCAPCACYVLEYLSRFFDITALYYNPNIFPSEEYDRRALELKKLLACVKYPNRVDLIVADHDAAAFDAAAACLWDEPEGGRRCKLCFELRLEQTAARAKSGGYDYFSTTLSVSPHKNAVLLNEIGGGLSEKYGVKYLYSDFKKRDGYKRSTELSKQLGLYRQNYCGCRFTAQNKSAGSMKQVSQI